MSEPSLGANNWPVKSKRSDPGEKTKTKSPIRESGWAEGGAGREEGARGNAGVEGEGEVAPSHPDVLRPGGEPARRVLTRVLQTGRRRRRANANAAAQAAPDKAARPM